MTTKEPPSKAVEAIRAKILAFREELRLYGVSEFICAAFLRPDGDARYLVADARRETIAEAALTLLEKTGAGIYRMPLEGN